MLYYLQIHKARSENTMAIGERIHFFRLLRGMTQKYLGTLVGFPERSADVRLAQYETGSRKPKADLTATLAQVLDVAPQALDVPDIDKDDIRVWRITFCADPYRIGSFPGLVAEIHISGSQQRIVGF